MRCRVYLQFHIDICFYAVDDYTGCSTLAPILATGSDSEDWKPKALIRPKARPTVCGDVRISKSYHTFLIGSVWFPYKPHIMCDWWVTDRQTDRHGRRHFVNALAPTMRGEGAFYTFSHRNFAESNSHFIRGSISHFRIFALHFAFCTTPSFFSVWKLHGLLTYCDN